MMQSKFYTNNCGMGVVCKCFFLFVRLLREVLTKDEEMIRKTLKELPTQFIPSLVDELTQLTQKKTVK